MAQQKGQVAAPYYTPPSIGSNQVTASTSGKGNRQPPRATIFAAQAMARLWQQASRTLKGQFILLASLSMLLALGLALFISLSFLRSADDLSTIAQGSILSIDAAQAMAQLIADIDAKTADYLATAGLTEQVPCSVVSAQNQTVDRGQQTVHDCDKLNIDAEILLANQQLFNVAHNVTYPGERTAVERITEGFEEYIGHQTVMLHEYDLATSKTEPNDEHLMRAYQAYMQASNVLHVKIERQPSGQNSTAVIQFSEQNVPSCQITKPIDSSVSSHVLPPSQWVLGSLEMNLDCLSSINKQHLDQAHDDTVGFLGITRWSLIVFCVIFCALLLFSIWRMTAITHRVINPSLTIALLTGVIFSIVIVSFFGKLDGRHGAYGQMVKDDYDSVYYATELNRYSTNANADESRWLIALTFQDQNAANLWAADWGTNTVYVHNLITRAHANRTWPEEDQPLADMDKQWSTYSHIDAQIRTTANNVAMPTHLLDAERLSTGTSNQAFESFTDAVNRLRMANYDHYNATLKEIQGTLQTLIPLSTLLFPFTGLLAVWGISRRLRDF